MSKSIKVFMPDKERTNFELHTLQMDLRQIKESIEANNKLIHFFLKNKDEIPQVLEMMQDVLQKELDHREKRLDRY